MDGVKQQRLCRRQRRRDRRLEAFRKVANVPELLTLIFVYCTRRNVPKRYLERFPLNISHVCKYWRELAHSTPQIWTSIKLRCPNPNRETVERHLALLNHWYTLSSSLPVSVHIHYPIYDLRRETSPEALSTRVREVLDFVSRQPFKAKEVTVATEPSIMASFYRMLSRPAPALEVCRLTPTSSRQLIYRGRHSTEPDINLAHNTNIRELLIGPNWGLGENRTFTLPLSLVALELMDGNAFIHPDQLPVTTLKRLVLAQVYHQVIKYTNMLLSVPSFFPKLEHLEISITSRLHYLIASGKMLSFPDLRSMAVKADCYVWFDGTEEGVVTWFDHLLVPALRCLKLQCQPPFSPRDPVRWPHLREFILRSNVKLHALILEFIEIPEDEVLSVLECLPNLSVLVLYGRYTTEYTVACLTLPIMSSLHTDTITDSSYTSYEPILCPHLRSLKLAMRQDQPSHASILNLIASRRQDYEVEAKSGQLGPKRFSTLLSCAFTVEDPDGFWVHPDIRDHIKNGLDIILFPPP